MYKSKITSIATYIVLGVILALICYLTFDVTTEENEVIIDTFESTTVETEVETLEIEAKVLEDETSSEVTQ